MLELNSYHKGLVNFNTLASPTLLTAIRKPWKSTPKQNIKKKYGNPKAILIFILKPTHTSGTKRVLCDGMAGFLVGVGSVFELNGVARRRLGLFCFFL
ncbi:MAG: hypothetical protein QXL96_09455 [Ignisphaera sp.]